MALELLTANPTSLREENSSTLIPGTAVSLDGNALLFVGKSGTGKSSLALEMMQHGAVLIGDDKVSARTLDGKTLLSPPPNFEGQIEARGIGILSAEFGSGTLKVIVDLDKSEVDRLPERKTTKILSISVPLLHKVESRHFPFALLQYLKGGRVAGLMKAQILRALNGPSFS